MKKVKSFWKTLSVQILFLLTGCGHHHNSGTPPTLTLETPCTTDCSPLSDRAATEPLTGTGTIDDPIVGAMCNQSDGAYAGLVLNATGADSLSCTSASDIDSEISGTTSITIKAAVEIIDPETFSCTAENSAGSDTLYFNVTTGLCGGCFTPETKVLMADKSTKRIIDVALGDKILGANGKINIVSEFERPVLKSTRLYSFNGCSAFTTLSHPFMTIEGLKAINPEIAMEENPGLNITKLTAGDVLVTQDGKHLFLETITAGKELNDFQVYNLITTDDNTYFVEVSNRFVLVHS